jgi:hypothetical protein
LNGYILTTTAPSVDRLVEFYVFVFARLESIADKRLSRPIELI